jgi:hypothetical protein
MEVHLEFHADHVLAVAVGEFERSVAQEQLTQALQACRERGVTRLLIDGRGLAGRVTLPDRFDMAAQIASDASSAIRVVFLVTTENMFTKALEAAAVNRGAQVRSTDSLEEAVAFLGIAAS